MQSNGDTIKLKKQDQSLSHIRAQVARILLEHAEDGKNGNNRLAQRDIADMLGVDCIKVHLSIRSLYYEGIIKMERNRIIIKKELIRKVAGIA